MKKQSPVEKRRHFLTVRLPKLIFFFFLITLSSNAVFIVFLPLFLLSQLSTTLGGYPFDVAQLLGLIEFIAPIIFAFVLYKILKKAKTQKELFLLILPIFIISYSVIYMSMILDVRAIEETIALFIFVVFLAFTASLLWREIISENKLTKGYLLLIPLSLNALYIFTPVGSNSDILIVYLNKISNYNFNLYFLDYGGYTIATLNTINATIGLLLIGIASLLKQTGGIKNR